jgi:shikimate dehydrogenase
MTSTTRPHPDPTAPDARVLRRDTRLCISLSGRPSNIGTKFHNYLYNELDLDYVYKAFSTTDLPSAIAGIRGLDIRGAGISMPFKEAVIDLVDVMHDSAAAIDSVNTIVNDDGTLHAYNTDYQAAANLLRDSGISTGSSVAIAGSGGMAKAVVAALRDEGFADTVVVARNKSAGRALADRYGFTWQPELGTQTPDLLVNATPIGMAGGPDAEGMPFSAAAVGAAQAVFDVVAMPSQTPLITAATGKTVITGAQVIALQAAEQFVLYTGVRPTDAQVAAASEFSRS